MSALVNLYRDIGREIGDPSNTKVLSTELLVLINRVLDDATLLTDCLQETNTLAGTGSAFSFGTQGGAGELPADVWRIITVADLANGYIYRPIKRREYPAAYISLVTNSIVGEYVYSMFGVDANRKIYVLPTPANSTTITVEHSVIHATVTDAGSGTETPAGRLDDYDRLIITGVASLHYASEDNYEKAERYADEYWSWVERLNNEVGVNPIISPEASALHKHISKTMKELRDM